MKIISWNVNGIRAVEKKGFISWINDYSPDVLALQETKAHEGQLSPSLTQIPGYYSYFASAERKGYSGVVIYTKTKPKEIVIGMDINRFDLEGRMITADFGNFIFSNIYFPNGKASQERLDYKMDFYKFFLEFINKLRLKNKNILFAGDVNTAHKEIDLARPKENENQSGFLPIERAWIDKVINNNFIDTFREFNKEPGQYSWWDYKTKARERNIGWRIDYIFINQDLKKNIKNAFILKDVQGSDHCPVGIDIDF